VVADGVNGAERVAVAVVAGDDPRTAGCERGGGRAPVRAYLVDVDLVHVGRQTIGDFPDELCRQGDPAAAAACHATASLPSSYSFFNRVGNSSEAAFSFLLTTLSKAAFSSFGLFIRGSPR
jgi:hypothetical protein